MMVAAAMEEKSSLPCWIPSPVHMTQLTTCRNAPMMAGVRAASCTSLSGEKMPRRGRLSSCRAPMPSPTMRPHSSRRSAACLAGSSEPPSLRMRARSEGMMTLETAFIASAATAPSWKSCRVIECAAAAVPVVSRVCVVRVTASSAAFTATERSSTLRLPSSSGESCLRDGGFTNLLQLIMPRVERALTYSTTAVSSARQVASAAPETPIAPEKMKIGSSTTLTRLEAAVIFSGVTTSSVPRKAANPTVLSSAATKVQPRMAR
mmetsp:Transcript_30513/g.65741  ORF Transcript_30513/g.65741 Transcript_30513/m.65741 type:complete len:263 (-) Transcript_30513:208-996(-)